MIKLVRRRTPHALAREFEPSAQAIRNCVRQATLDAGQRMDGPLTYEREELGRRRENRYPPEERLCPLLAPRMNLYLYLSKFRKLPSVSRCFWL